MKVSGFSFLRDGVRLGYPFIESLQSALPICDEFVVAVDRGQDDSLERLRALQEPKLRIIETSWNENMRQHGFVYGQQKMVAQYNCTGDWAFYLEGDEVLHEDELHTIRQAMQRYLHDDRVEALTFDYHHFYGDPHTVYANAQFYRKAARIIKNTVRSIAPDGLYWAVIKDQTWFRRRNKRRNRYPRAAETGAAIYHYGNCRAEHYLAAKAEIANQYWNDGGWPSVYGNVDAKALGRFTGSHPAVIRPWLAEHANPALHINPDYQLTPRDKKHRLLSYLEKLTGHDFSKRHFKLVK